MDTTLADHMASTFFDEYQSLRPQLMAIISDEDLAFRPGADTFTLGELCREIGEIEQCYVDAFRTFRQDFAYRHPDPAVAGSIAALSTWYTQLDGDLMSALEALTPEDVTSRPIDRGDGFTPLAPQLLDIYREALLIFYSKVSIYLRLMGKTRPRQWQHWIG